MLVRKEEWKKHRAVGRTSNVKIKVYLFYSKSGYKHVKFFPSIKFKENVVK